MSGLFLTLEGIDGAGKSSHIDALEALFRAAGRVVTRTREMLVLAQAFDASSMP